MYLKSRTDSLCADLLTLTLFMLVCQYLPPKHTNLEEMYSADKVRREHSYSLASRSNTLSCLRHHRQPSKDHCDSIPLT